MLRSEGVSFEALGVELQLRAGDLLGSLPRELRIHEQAGSRVGLRVRHILDDYLVVLVDGDCTGQLWHAAAHCLLSHELLYFAVVLQWGVRWLDGRGSKLADSLRHPVLQVLSIEDELAMVDEIFTLKLAMQILNPLPQATLALCGLRLGHRVVECFDQQMKDLLYLRPHGVQLLASVEDQHYLFAR